jgi:hypothetical protein
MNNEEAYRSLLLVLQDLKKKKDKLELEIDQTTDQLDHLWLKMTPEEIERVEESVRVGLFS